MSILIERATDEKRAQFFAKNKWVIARLIGEPCSEEVAEEKPKRKRKTKAKPKKGKAKSTQKAKQKETPVVEEKKTPDPVVEESTVSEVAEEVTPATPASNDDLTQIKGLGPKMAESLHAAGITTFQALSELTAEQITAIGENIRGFAATYENKAFKTQAATLAC